jgi:hypothetical protein
VQLTLRTNTQCKLGAVALCALMLAATMFTSGCSPASAAKRIVALTPALDAATLAADATAAALDPALAPLATAITASVDAGSAELDAQAKAYLAAPSADLLAHLQIAATTLEQTVNAALLKAAGISGASAGKLLADIKAVAAIAATILALVQTISTKAQVARMAADAPLKLAAVRPYLDERTMGTVAERYGTTVDAFFAQEARAGF